MNFDDISKALSESAQGPQGTRKPANQPGAEPDLASLLGVLGDGEGDQGGGADLAGLLGGLLGGGAQGQGGGSDLGSLLGALGGGEGQGGADLADLLGGLLGASGQ